MSLIKQSILLVALWAATLSLAQAWTEPTHEDIVVDALRYMNSTFASADERRAYDFYVDAANGFDNAAKILSQAVSDVDRFEDTRLGSWWSGYSHAPLFGLADSLVNYTSYWHFINMTRGRDAHGNDHGGYDVRYHTEDNSGFLSDVDTIAKNYLYYDALKKADFNGTESKYRLGSYSSYQKHYKDFYKMPFQPVDHLGAYWFGQFKAKPTLQMIGHALHAIGDSAQPHHTYVTSGNKHAGWEAWVEDFYVQKNLNNPITVNQILAEFDAQKDFQEILTQTAENSYLYPEVLTDEREVARLEAAKYLIPLATASSVTILTKGVNYFFGEGGQ